MQKSHENDPDFLSIIVPMDFDKIKKNPSYPSCTFRDKNPLLYSQFYLCILILKLLDEEGLRMLFLHVGESDTYWWGKVKINILPI